MEESIKRRKSWKLWSWKKTALTETNPATQSAILKPINISMPIEQDIKLHSPLERSKRNLSSLSGRSLSLRLRSSPISGSPTPDFTKLPLNLSNSLLISMFDPNSESVTLSVGKTTNSIALFNDEQILYYPHQKNTIDTMPISKRDPSRKDKEKPLKKSMAPGLFTIRNMRLPETIKYQSNVSKFNTIGEPDRLWNVWVEVPSASNGRTRLQVKKKVFDKSSIEELANDYDYILEFYVHDKGHNLFLWPFGTEKPPIGKLKRQSKYEPFVFWVPLGSGSACWYGISVLLFLGDIPFHQKITGVSWKGEADGYWLTFHSNGIKEEDEIQLFLSDLVLSLVKVCNAPNQTDLLQRIFSATRTIDKSHDSVAVINM